MFEIRSSQLRGTAGLASAPVRPQSRRTSTARSTRSSSSNSNAARRSSQSSVLSLNRTVSNLSEQEWQSGTDMRIIRLSKHPNLDKWVMTVRPDGVSEATVPLERPYCEAYISVAFTNAYNNWETQSGDMKGLIRIVRLDYEWRKRANGRVEVRNIKWPREKQPKAGTSLADYARVAAQLPLALLAAPYAVFHHRSDLQHAFGNY